MDKLNAAELENLANRFLKKLPGKAFFQEQIGKAEHRVLSELKNRLDTLDGEGRTVRVSTPLASVNVTTGSTSGSRRTRTPSESLLGLLSRAMEQSHEDAVKAAASMMVSNMLPDEARIFSALSDGSTYPLIHILSGPWIGIASQPTLEYICSVGRAAGVLAPELTPLYVRRLTNWGLTEVGQEQDDLITGYEVLETDDSVRKLIERLSEDGHRSRVIRRTLRISALGSQIWKACQIEDIA